MIIIMCVYLCLDIEIFIMCSVSFVTFSKNVEGFLHFLLKYIFYFGHETTFFGYWKRTSYAFLTKH